MTEEVTFEQGETVSVWYYVLDWDGNYTDPSEGCTVTITDSAGTVKVDGSAMTKSATGKYVYYYTLASDAAKNWWSIKTIAQDGTGGSAKYTSKVGGFKVR